VALACVTYVVVVCNEVVAHMRHQAAVVQRKDSYSQSEAELEVDVGAGVHAEHSTEAC
jgi:hypothetical protein